MKLERLIKTINLASQLHDGQHRRDAEKTPYISHLVGAALLVSSVTTDEDIIAAALMHDSLEDVPDYTYEDLAEDCGERVAEIVKNVTEDKSLPYAERKRAYLEHLQNSDADSVLVSVADKIHNALSFENMEDKHKHNGHFIIYAEVLKIAKSKIPQDHKYYPLVERLGEVVGREGVV